MRQCDDQPFNQSLCSMTCMMCKQNTELKCTKECGGLTKDKTYRVIKIHACFTGHLFDLSHIKGVETMCGGLFAIRNDDDKVRSYCALRFEVVGGAKENEEDIHDGTAPANDGK